MLSERFFTAFSSNCQQTPGAFIPPETDKQAGRRFVKSITLQEREAQKENSTLCSQEAFPTPHEEPTSPGSSQAGFAAGSSPAHLPQGGRAATALRPGRRATSKRAGAGGTRGSGGQGPGGHGRQPYLGWRWAAPRCGRRSAPAWTCPAGSRPPRTPRSPRSSPGISASHGRCPTAAGSRASTPPSASAGRAQGTGSCVLCIAHAYKKKYA